MRKMNNHQIVKEIIESFKEKITGNKKASRATVIIVAVVFVIVAVTVEFGKYVSENRLFPHLIEIICRNHESDTSDPDVKDNMEIESTVWRGSPSNITKFPGETPPSTNTTTKRNDQPTTSKEKNSDDFISEVKPSIVVSQPREQPPPSNETTKNTIAKTITVSCIPIAFSLTDKNAEIRAVTSFKATKVVLICEATGFKHREWNMKTSDSRVWTFDANFYEPNTYTLTVTAYDSNGEQVQDSIVIQYPFT